MSGNGEEDKKPAEGGAHINLKVKGQQQLELYKVRCLGLTCNLPYPGLHFTALLTLLIGSSVQLLILEVLICVGGLIRFDMHNSTDYFLFFLRSTLHNAIAFLFDGRRLRGEQTPDELEMEDGDEIDAMLHQTGGYVPSA
uniref:Ubiquitin-like domain-containing protein n=1 Tax=Setaria italica TaxID=4555 RepID=K3XS44_SETIT